MKGDEASKTVCFKKLLDLNEDLAEEVSISSLAHMQKTFFVFFANQKKGYGKFCTLANPGQTMKTFGLTKKTQKNFFCFATITK